MSRLSVSFLVDEMRRVPGGCGPNIAYGLALFGERPGPAGDGRATTRPSTATGSAREGVDVSACAWSRTSSRPPSSSRRTWTRTSSPPSTRAPWRGPGSCRYPFAGSRDDRVRGHLAQRPAGDGELRAGVPASSRSRSSTIPASRSTRLSAEEMREGFRGAAILIVNDYELGILSHKTGLTAEQLAGEVPVFIVTHGADGSTIHAPDGRGGQAVHEIPAGPGRAGSRGPHRGRRHVPRGAAARPAGRRAVARGRTDRKHQRRLRARSPRPPAAALHAGRVRRALPAQLRRRARARAAVRLVAC